MSWRTIVVGYEPSHASAVALARAADIADVTGATLVVTSVAGALTAEFFDAADEPEQRLEELRHARELLANHDARVEYDLEAGDPADALMAIAKRRQAGLIVVGIHDRRLLDRLLHGSVSNKVALHATCDVLIVR
jgi:nucleotide-binding universal stress UspA family protein